jgi:hypothetical protein
LTFSPQRQKLVQQLWLLRENISCVCLKIVWHFRHSRHSAYPFDSSWSRAAHSIRYQKLDGQI